MTPDWLRNPVQALHHEARTRARQRQHELTKPAGSLGVLEQCAIDLAAMQGRERPAARRVFISVFAADHGVVEEGVSAYPQAVTQQMLTNFVAGGAAVSVLAKSLGALLEVVDVGTLSPHDELAGVMIERAGAGTANLARQPAMQIDQLAGALDSGRHAAARAAAAGTDIFIAGEMGIGNTTAATAVAAALLTADAHELAGPGSGLDSEGIRHKAEVVNRALRLHAPDASQPLQVLQRLGGFEIAAIAGACVACAQAGIPVLVDGFIATAAALAATRIQPDVRNWLLFAHRSAEPGHSRLLESLQGRPLLDLEMRLGEGSAAAVAVHLLRSACSLHDGMATFAEAGVAERDDA